jgi:hypothetical protein
MTAIHNRPHAAEISEAIRRAANAIRTDAAMVLSTAIHISDDEEVLSEVLLRAARSARRVAAILEKLVEDKTEK